MPTRDRTPKTVRTPVDDLRGATRLAIEATRGVTDLVEAMHHNIGGGPSILGRPLEGPTRLLTGPVYGSIRGVTRLVGAGIDVALAQLARLLAPLMPVRAALSAAPAEFYHCGIRMPLGVALGGCGALLCAARAS